MYNWRYDIKCCECGRFVPYGADSGIHWGHSYDYEPPDPHWFCEECADRNFGWYVERGYVPNAWWISPAWAVMARRVLGVWGQSDSQVLDQNGGDDG